MKNIVDLKGKVGLVTGGGGGIGRAVAQTLAALDVAVVVADLVREPAEETVRSIEASGGKAFFMGCDIADAASVQNLIDGIVAQFGRLDLAHNNAGREGRFAPIVGAEEADFDRGVAVNLKGTWLCLRAEIRQMMAQGGGAIVNTASAIALAASPMDAAYGAAKAGVISLTKSAAVECAAHNIRVNAICPGMTRTAMSDRLAVAVPGIGGFLRAPLGRMGEAGEMAGMVAFLLSDAASYITGQHVVVDGGHTIT